MWSKKEIGLSFYLLIIYIVGIIGIALPIHKDFVYLTPMNFCVSLGIVFFAEKNKSKSLYIAALLVFIIGFLAEAIGVNDGRLFGDFYTYGSAMGWQIFKTPLTAGLLWVTVVSGVSASLNYFFPKKNNFIKSTIGALILVGLDLLIEPVAIKLDFWQWAHEAIPFQNYVGWFGIGFLNLLIFNLFIPFFKNKLAIVLFLLQFLFFGIFNFL